MPSSRLGQSRHRPWDPLAYAASASSQAICKEAMEDQFQFRSQRLSPQNKRARRGKGEQLSVEALIADCIAHTLTDADRLTLSVSLSAEALSGSRNGYGALNRGISDRLADLRDTGWLRVSWGHNRGRGKKTTFNAGPKLLERMNESGVSLGDIGRKPTPGGQLELKGSKAGPDQSRPILPFKDTPEVIGLVRQVNQLNDLFQGASLSQVSSDCAPLDISRRSVKRSFLDGAFNRGGRLKGAAFWFDVEKTRRRKVLLIDDEPIAELDLKSATPTIAYALEGVSLPHDPYMPPEFCKVPRDVMKKAFMKFLWDTPKKGARLPQEVAKHISGNAKLYRVLDALKRHNGPIADYLYADEPKGAELMFLESEIIIEATFRCYAEGVTALPLHDALLVPLSKKEKARECFSQAFEDRLGVPPVIVQDWPKE